MYRHGHFQISIILFYFVTLTLVKFSSTVYTNHQQPGNFLPVTLDTKHCTEVYQKL